MLENGMTHKELQELLDQVVDVLEDDDLSSDEKIAEIESVLLGDDEEA